MSIWHWLIVLVVVVLIFGTKKLRNVGQDLGGAVKGFKEGMKGAEARPTRPSRRRSAAAADPRADHRRRGQERQGGLASDALRPRDAHADRMFDIGFCEIVVIAVVALIVIGPEKLPKMARTLGHLFGRLQRYVNDVKADINREMELDELRKLQKQVQTAARRIETSVSSAANEVSRACARSNPSSTRRAADAGHEAAARRDALRRLRPPCRREPAPRRAAAAACRPNRRGRRHCPGFERG